MSIYKDNVTGKWRVVYRYTDWTGKTKQTSKRGFPTKREAQMWEHEQMLKHDAKLDMTFASFYEIYVEDKKERIRDNTWATAWDAMDYSMGNGSRLLIGSIYRLFYGECLDLSLIHI